MALHEPIAPDVDPISLEVLRTPARGDQRRVGRDASNAPRSAPS